MSDRTPSTDALETLGMIHFKPEKRDAIHLAVDPVIAGQWLQVGERIGIVNGFAWTSGTRILNDVTKEYVIVPYHGIVDPFLPQPVQPTQSFWFVMAPRMVCSLRHVWSHPEFTDE